MARWQTHPKDSNWKYIYCFATHSVETIHVYTWTCPDCKTSNRTIVNTRDTRQRNYDRGIEARCGHCHGNKRRLTNKSGLTFDPSSD